MKKSVAMLNSFTNFLSGLGTARGKSAYSGFQRDFINPKDLIDLYSSSWLASKGVDIPIADMLRGFREMEGSPLPHDVKFSVVTVLKEALTYLRVVGGSVIHFDTGMEDLSTPYRYNETLLRLIAIPCTSISPVGDETINRLNDVNYGMPEYFSINGDNENKIHISRLYIFPAKAPFRTYSGSNNAGFWKSGMLEKAFKTIVRAGVVDSLIEDIVHQKNVDTFKIEGLMEMCSTDEGTSSLLKRFALDAQSKSSYNARLIDATEEYIQTESSLAGTIDVLKHSFQSVASAFDIPATRMLGTSTTGLNSNGESDLINYFQNIESSKQEFLMDFLKRFDEVTRFTPNGSTQIKFASSRIKTDNERSEFDAKVSESAMKISALLTPEIAARYLIDNINLNITQDEIDIISLSASLDV